MFRRKQLPLPIRPQRSKPFTVLLYKSLEKCVPASRLLVEDYLSNILTAYSAAEDYLAYLEGVTANVRDYLAKYESTTPAETEQAAKTRGILLRSWCLEVEPVVTISRNGSESSLQQHRRSHSNASSVGSSVLSGEDSRGLFATSGSGSSSRLLTFEASPSQGQGRSSKYYPEERTLIEGLMFRVMECGEVPARNLQWIWKWTATRGFKWLA